LLEYLELELERQERSEVQSSARRWSPTPEKPTQAQASEGAPVLTSTGSGFRIGQGMVITNHHVIDGCKLLRVNGTPSQLAGADAYSDLALIKTTAASTALARLRNSRLKLGEQVTVAGYPLQNVLTGLNVTSGNVSSLFGPNGNTRLLQISAPVQPGNSGGPLLDSAGNLTGVVVSKLNAVKIAAQTGDIPQNVNFAISANALRAFLEANDSSYETATSDKPISSENIADMAKTFTVLVECFK